MKKSLWVCYTTKIIWCFLVFVIAFFTMSGCSESGQSENEDSYIPSAPNNEVNKSTNEPKILMRSLSNGYGFTIKAGNTKQMSVEVTPDNVSDKSVEWFTNDESVAGIDSKTGLLTAKTAGTVKVTVKALDGSGIKDSCTVSVVCGMTTWKPTTNRKIHDSSLPYYLYFEKDAYTISVYGKGNDGYYSKLIRTISSSRGRTLNMTPAGSFRLSREKRWYQFKKGLYWTQYCIKFTGDIYLHGPLYKKASGDTMYINEYNQIGTASTAGCLAMTTADIKWIWENCPDGTSLEIVSGAPIGNVAQVPPRILKDGPAIDPTDPELK